MTCYVCKHSYCWICGLPSDHIFHKIQIDTSETGALCVFINNVLELFKEFAGYKCLPIIYLFLAIFCLVAPPIVLALGVLGGLLLFPFMPCYYVYEFEDNVCPHSVNNKCALVCGQIVILLMLYPAQLILGATILAGACLGLVIYYPLAMIAFLASSNCC